MTPLPPECEAALQQLDALRRGELSAEATAALRGHLAACQHCLCVERYERAFLERVREAGTSVGCPDALRESIRRQCADGPCDD